MVCTLKQPHTGLFKSVHHIFEIILEKIENICDRMIEKLISCLETIESRVQTNYCVH